MNSNHPSHVLGLPKWTTIIYGIIIVLSIIILSLDAYGIYWIPYNALIFSLVAAIVSLLVCGYIIVTTLSLHKLYNMYVVLSLHILMILFWIVDMGLVANLAHLWSEPACSYSYVYGYYCSYGKRDTTTTGAYYGALAAGAFFGSVQFVLWVICTVFVVIYLNRHRSGTGPSASNPPAYVESGHAGQSVPLEHKYGGEQNVQAHAPPQHQQPYQQQPHQQQPQQAYSAAPTPHVQPAQPMYGQQQQSPYGSYVQDPVNRTNTISPVSQAQYTGHSAELQSPHHTGGYSNPAVSELSSPQHAGNYNPNVSELSTR